MPRANQLVISTWLHSPVLSSHLALSGHNYTSSAVYGHRIGCSFHHPTIHIYFPPACWSGHRHSCLALLLKVKLQPAMQPYLGYRGISIATQQATSDLGCRPSCHQSGSSTPFIQSRYVMLDNTMRFYAAPPWHSQDHGPAAPCNSPPGAVRFAPFLATITVKRRQSGGTGGTGVLGSTLLMALSSPCTHTISSST